MENKKITQEEYLNKLQNINKFIIPLENYINGKTTIKHKCLICNNEFKATPYNLLRGSNCPICLKESIKKRTEKKYLNKRFGECIVIKRIDDYISPRGVHGAMFLCKCDCGNIFKARINNLLNNYTRHCKNCHNNIPYGERFGMKVLSFIESKENIVYQYSIENLISNSGNKLRFDVFIKNKNIFIEYDGQTHIEPFYCVKDKKKSIEKTKLHDKLKNEYVKSINGILIRIPYYEKTKFEDLKNGILESDLKNFYNLNLINFKECQLYAEKSLSIEVCEKYKELGSNVTANYLSQFFPISEITIRNILRRCHKSGVIIYDENFNRKETMKNYYSGENSPNYGLIRSKETRKKMSESKKGKYCGENSPNYGKKLTKEQKEKISMANKGNEYWKRVDYSKFKGKNNPNLKKIICEDILFDASYECAKYYNVSKSTISNALTGNKPMPKIWYERGLRYEYETIQERNNRINISYIGKKVICDERIFDSVKECSKFYGYMGSSALSAYLIGKINMPKFWYDKGLRYENETINDMNKRIKIGKSQFEASSVKVICENNIFLSIAEFNNYYQIKGSQIYSYLSGKKDMPKKWYDMGLRYENETIEERNKRIKLSKRKPINKSCKKVIYENIIFESIKECSNYLNVKSSTLCGWLNGSYKMPQKWKDIGLAYYIESEENE